VDGAADLGCRPRCPAAGHGEIALKGAKNVMAQITAPGRFPARRPLPRVRVALRGLTALAAATAGTVMVTGCQIGSDSAPAHQAVGLPRPIAGSHRAAPPRIRPAAADVGSGPTCSHHGCDNTDPIQTGCADGSQYTVVSVPVKLRDGTVVATINLRYSPTCGTNWAQIENTTGDNADLYVGPVGGAWTNLFTSNANDAYTNQLWLPCTPAQAAAFVYTPEGVAVGEAQQSSSGGACAIPGQ
jgi:hypothetical protein